ncbi:MAG: hypothetical protein HKN46_09450 [Acidimicrobiia bacterium]|nr:hypothetical protein [Acidimicrobiia bacterium]
MAHTIDLRIPPAPNGKDVLVPESADAWRRWLANHPDRTEGIWLVYRKKASDLEGPLQPALLDEALCFGWIDSKVVPVDEQRTMQWFSPRRKGSIWSARNREYVARLEAEGRLAPAGMAAIETAKADGSWTITDTVDALEIPDELVEAFASVPEAQVAFEALSESHKKRHLWWIHSAKRPETRARRVAETIETLIDPERG